MLARANRVVRAEDFRMAVRRGERVGSASAVVYVRDRADPGPSRFGLLVGKAVGNAVTRNRVSRRLRSACRELLGAAGSGNDIVIRALSGSGTVPWANLLGEISESVDRGVGRR